MSTQTVEPKSEQELEAEDEANAKARKEEDKALEARLLKAKRSHLYALTALVMFQEELAGWVDWIWEVSRRRNWSDARKAKYIREISEDCLAGLPEQLDFDDLCGNLPDLRPEILTDHYLRLQTMLDR